jgi:ABC-2 type transport system permease protein
MRNVLYVAGKELRSYFVSPVAYIVAGLWLVGTGVFFYAAVSLGQDASLRNVFGVITVLLLFVAPALTMRLLAEESRTGTLELLLTAPVRDWAVVLGKFLGALALYVVMIGLTLVYPLILILFGGTPDWGPIWSGYLGLVLFGMAFLAVGLFSSALTSNQMVAAVVSVVILVVLYVISQFSASFGGGLGDFLTKISLRERFDPFERGIVDLRDIIFYLTFTALVLFLTIQVVEARRYRS